MHMMRRNGVPLLVHIALFVRLNVCIRGLEPFSSLDEASRAKIEMNKEGLDWERIAEEVLLSSC